MASRRSIEVVIRVPADGGDPPNRYVPEITAQIRLHWPPRNDHKLVYSVLSDAIEATVLKLKGEFDV